ncbi:MAG: acyl carrier protein [Verrucomicrobia bacterium]|jgi:acyl carrier protein|nr:acyl carrier protein [Verrucomicrobiota bacterium]
MNTLDEFIETFENTVEDIEPGSLNGQTIFRSLKQWDSLAVLMVVNMVDAEYDVRLNSRQMKEAETLGELYQLIANKREAG